MSEENIIAIWPTLTEAERELLREAIRTTVDQWDDLNLMFQPRAKLLEAAKHFRTITRGALTFEIQEKFDHLDRKWRAQLPHYDTLIAKLEAGIDAVASP